MIPETKVCGKCNIEKKACEFPLRKKCNGKYVWLRMQCYKCMREIAKESYLRRRDVIIKRNAEYTKKNWDKVYARQEKWRADNADRIKKERKEKYLKKAEKIKQDRKNYYYKNKEKVIALNNDYVVRNKSKVRERQRANHHKKKKENIHYRLIRILRGRVLMAVKNKGKKCNRTVNLVGCSIDFLMKHLESQFKDGMSWDNQGKTGWHIDHKKPCASFDLSNPEEQMKCFHWSNLQPLWWYDNLKKGAKEL